MIAHLCMYDRPETAAANDRLWSAIRAQLGFGPETLTRDADVWEVWQSSDLLLSQTCGMPFRTRLYDKVQLVGSPDYGLPGCPPGHYCSVFVAHKDREDTPLSGFDRGCFAYNEALSQSGWAAPINHMSPLGISPGSLLESGGHQNSALAVAEGRADFASLDALTWELIRKHDDFAADLVEITRTEPTPVLPYITANGRDAGELFAAIETAIVGLDDSDKQALHLRGITTISAADYLAVPTPIGPALMMHQKQISAK